ncbi:MAG: DUF4058 family protein [bacterium]|nr:DUF4058 family protein [bacterium]
MPIHSDRNLYPGINPHLNSYLQHITGWKGFHNKHLEHIAEALEALLPQAYYIAGEESLQIGTYDLPTELIAPEVTEETIPDITIYKAEGSHQPFDSASQASTPTLTLPVIDVMAEPEYINSLVIYRVEAGTLPGEPITRIELLSPANKPPGSHYKDYRAKRLKTIGSGMRLVEIDYLHERRPVDPRIPSYISRHPDSRPYNIVISDPHPSLSEGVAGVYGFGVMESLPRIAIPLDRKDRVTLDFSAIYNRTFSSARLFWQILVDYEKDPVNVEAYHEADRVKIREQMAKIAAEQAVKREEPPYP